MMMFSKLFYGFSLSFSMLTVIPFFKVHHFYKGINGYAVMFYPLVGFILGGVLAGFYYALHPYINESYLYVLTFALWVGLTGALHLDGVADVFDALFVSKQRREEVLKDPHIGAMGMIFTFVFMLVKLAALMQVGLIYLLPLVLMFSRFNVVMAIYFFPYKRKKGMASLAKSEFRMGHFLLSVLMVICIGVGESVYFSTWMIAFLFLPLVLVYILAKRIFGGFSGDLYGLLIEFTELVLLHIIMFPAHL